MFLANKLHKSYILGRVIVISGRDTAETNPWLSYSLVIVNQYLILGCGT